jgi:hypothetical protein
MGFIDIFRHPEAVGFGSALTAAVVFAWRKMRKSVFIEYGPEIAPTGQTLLKLSIYFVLPKRVPPTRDSEGGK